MHENAHVQAYRQKGYHNNTISLRFPDVVTTNHDEIRPEDKSDIYNANMMIEAVGYNIQAWGVGVMIMSVFIVVELIGIKRGEK